MAPKLDQIQRIARAAKIREFLENDYVIEAFATIEMRWIQAIRKSTPAQVEQRESAYLIMRGLDDFRTELTKILNDGKVAQVQAAEAEANAE